MFSGISCMVMLTWGIIFVYRAVSYPSNMDNAELRLMEFLFRNHSADIRPVLNDKYPVVVHFGLMLKQIIDLDEKNQILTTNVWLRQFWSNPLLTWDPADFNNVTKINVDPSQRLWRPDILLFNAASTDRRTGSLYNVIDTKAIISHKGNISWLAPGVLSTECKIDVRYFPFDEQACSLEFGSWTHDGFRLDIQLFQDFGVDTEEYSDNIEWMLVGAPGRRLVKVYNCCEEPYPSLLFTLKLRRRAMFYLYNLMIPCGLIALLSLFSFYLPPESGERVSLVITVLLAMSVYMLLVTENMPQSAEVPLASKFFMAAMCQIALCLVMTCVVIRCHHNKRTMSRFLAFLVNGLLARVVLLKEYQIKRSTSTLSALKNSLKPSMNTIRQAHFNNASEELGNECTLPGSNNDIKTIDSSQPVREVILEKTISVKGKDTENTMKSVMDDLQFLTDRFREEDKVQETQGEWMFAAEVLDRFFMVTFFVTIVMTCAVVFAQAPNLTFK